MGGVRTSGWLLFFGLLYTLLLLLVLRLFARLPLLVLLGSLLQARLFLFLLLVFLGLLRHVTLLPLLVALRCLPGLLLRLLCCPLGLLGGASRYCSCSARIRDGWRTGIRRPGDSGLDLWGACLWILFTLCVLLACPGILLARLIAL